MQIKADTYDIITGNLPSSSGFTIKASAKAFRILSNNLYSDKIKAVIRELSCNAYDAHVAAGKKDKPFDVHLPNNFEPFFSVRDNGTGLSDEDVIHLYTTYFESTKTNSNDFVGALGLGSKSPFSYVDNFTVVSRFGGMKRSYLAFLNEGGIPSITKVGEEEHSGENGIEVSFPVETKDFTEFNLKAGHVYSWFKVLPNVTGSSIKLTSLIPDFEYKTARCKLSQNGSTYTGSLIALMGNVAYPIPLNSLNIETFAFSYAFSEIAIEFPIGSLDITPSREHLSLDTHTISVIKNNLTDLENHIIGLANDALSKYKTAWDQSVAYDSYWKNDSNADMGERIGFRLVNIRYNYAVRNALSKYKIISNFHTDSNIPIPLIKSLTDTVTQQTIDEWDKNVEVYEISTRHKPNPLDINNDIIITDFYKLGYRRRNSRIPEKVDSITLSPKSTKYIWFDTEYKHGAYVIGSFYDKGWTSGIRVRINPSLDPGVKKQYIDAFKRSIIKVAPTYNFFKDVSEYLTKVTIPTKPKLKAEQLKEFNRNKAARRTQGAINSLEVWDTVASLPKQVFYVPIHGHEILENDGQKLANGIAGLQSVITHAISVGIIPNDIRIFGIRSKLIDEVKGDKNFTNLYDYVSNKIKEDVAKNKYGDILATHENHAATFNNPRLKNFINVLQENSSQIKYPPDLNNFLHQWRRIPENDKMAKIRAVIALKTILKTDITINGTALIDYKYLADQMADKYEIISVAGRLYDAGARKILENTLNKLYQI